MKIIIALLLSYACVFSASSFAVEHGLTSAGDVVKYVTKRDFPQKMTARLANKSANEISSVNPICPTLATGNLYTLNNPQVGETICYHFEITEISKTTALLINQSPATNIDLSIIKHNPDDTFTVVGVSANPSSQDEVVIALTEPGHYYWFMDVVTTDNLSFDFGASIATNLDDYEFNDTIATATILPDKQNKIIGNMDSINDIDYFQFTSVRGQDIVLSLDDQQLGEWTLEVYNGGWIEVANNTDISVGNLVSGQNLVVRVTPNYNLPVNSSNNYKLTFGTKVTAISDSDISGEAGIIRVPYSSFGSLPYATTQAYRTLSWKLKLLDSTGEAVEGASAKFRLDKDVSDGFVNYVDYEEVSNSSGYVSGVVELGECYGQDIFNHIEYSLGYKNEWETELLYGVWRVEIPYTGSSNVGIGGDNVEFVFLGHLCDQRLVSSVPS